MGVGSGDKVKKGLMVNRRKDVISLNQLRGMSAKMAANGIPI